MMDTRLSNLLKVTCPIVLCAGRGDRWCRTPSTWGTDPAVPGTAVLLTSSALQVQ